MHGSSSLSALARRGVFDRAASPFNRVRRETGIDGVARLVCEYFAGANWIRTTRRAEEFVVLMRTQLPALLHFHEADPAGPGKGGHSTR